MSRGDSVDVLWGAIDDAAEPVGPHSDSPAGPDGSDEWEDLRSVLAGDDPSPPVMDDDVLEDDVEVDEDADEDEAPRADAHEVAQLLARVEALAAALEAEQTEREHLAAQLDRLATEFDAVLGEALDEERARREQVEATLRELQTTIADASSTWDGVERRSGVDRRSAAERRRGLAPRPLRGRRATDMIDEEPPAPADEAHDQLDDEPLEDERPSVWKSRLNDVAGSVSAWSSDDIDRLRVD